jgi:hypothetical protein
MSKPSSAGILTVIFIAWSLNFSGTAHAQRPEGIDSDFQTSAPNWSEVAADGSYGIQFACIKATALDEGFSNSYFASRMSGAQAAGIYTIPYNRCDPSVYKPNAEAQFFWNWAKTNVTAGGYNLSPALDIEDGLTGHYTNDTGAPVSLSAWCNDWFNDVSNYAAAAGVHLKQITYVNAGSSCDLSSSLHGYGWIAWTNCAWPYNSGEEQTSTPWCQGTGCEIFGSAAWTLWQWAWPGEGQGILNGLKEHVDQDVYNGTLAQMVAALGTTGTTPAFISTPTNQTVFAGNMLIVPATVFASPPATFYWSNLNTGTTIASGATNGVTLNGTINATLKISNVPANWNNDILRLTVTNSWGSTNLSITVGVTAPVLNMTTLAGGQMQLSWSSGGTLASATNVLGPYTTITGVSPYTAPITNTQMFYRIVQ